MDTACGTFGSFSNSPNLAISAVSEEFTVLAVKQHVSWLTVLVERRGVGAAWRLCARLRRGAGRLPLRRRHARRAHHLRARVRHLLPRRERASATHHI